MGFIAVYEPDSSLRKSVEHACFLEKSVEAMKSLRMMSSMCGCSGSYPFGGRLRDSPPREHFSLNALPLMERFQPLASVTIASRTCRKVLDSGCHTPQPAKTISGSMCK